VGGALRLALSRSGARRRVNPETVQDGWLGVKGGAQVCARHAADAGATWTVGACVTSGLQGACRLPRRPGIAGDGG